METTYIALMRKEKKSDYGVDFPDFQGCITAGKTLDEAKDMAIEALQGHIEFMQDEGYDIPSPSPLEKIMADPENADAVAFLVSVYPPKTKVKRINVTIPEAVLDRVDRFVKTHPVKNRSQFLVVASERYIDSTRRRGGGTVTVHGHARSIRKGSVVIKTGKDTVSRRSKDVRVVDKNLAGRGGKRTRMTGAKRK